MSSPSVPPRSGMPRPSSATRAQDDFGTPNPVADRISWVITRGSSQAGTFVRQLIHMGMTQDEANRKVYDGAWPIIAGRRIALNFRFAKPDLVLKLYEPGNEGPLWWHKHRDKVRGLPPRGMLDRCLETNSCPKIIEHAGAAEVWGQKLTVGWLGTDPKDYIPLPENVRRYYFASTPARRWRRRLRRQSGLHTRLLQQQLWPGHVPGESTAADGDHQCATVPFPQLGHEGHPAAGQRLPSDK